MCKHIINATTYIQYPCCLRWFECPECHDDEFKSSAYPVARTGATPLPTEKHPCGFQKTLRFCCKVCRKCFLREFELFTESDKKCPFCETVWCKPAITPERKGFDDSRRIIAAAIDVVVSLDNPYFKERSGS